MRLARHDTVTLHADCSALDGTRYTELPPNVLDSLPSMLGRVWPLFGSRAAAGVVLLTGPAAEALGYPAELPPTAAECRDHPVLTAPRAAGWKVSGLSAWSTFWSDGDRPTVHVAVHPWLTRADDPLFDPDPWEMGWHLTRYAELAGTPYHSTPGVTGIGLLRDGWRGRTNKPFWAPPDRTPKGAGHPEADMIWSAEPAPAGGTYRHSYDANVMYLGAAGTAQLAVSELRHTGPLTRVSWDTAGYWRIQPPRLDPTLSRLPSPLGWRRPGTRELWVTTPTVMLLEELATRDHPLCAPPVVLDSWTAPAKRAMRSWAETLTTAIGTARASGDPHDVRQVAALKATYRQAIGMLGRDSSRVFRPDWRHTVIATARWSMWRKLLAVAETEDRWPLAVNVDCVTYASATRDPDAARPKGIKLGTGAGMFKIAKIEGEAQ
jgi:hypothetical protein